MPRGYRSAIFAAGLTLCGSVAVGERPDDFFPEQKVEQQPVSSETTEQPVIESEPIVERRGAPANPAAEEHDHGAPNEENKEANGNAFQFLGDTWAQWAMVGISAWAVWLLKLTLDATRKTSDDVRATLEIERNALELAYRPILVFDKIDLIPQGDPSQIDSSKLTWSIRHIVKFRWKNVGPGPARILRARTYRHFDLGNALYTNKVDFDAIMDQPAEAFPSHNRIILSNEYYDTPTTYLIGDKFKITEANAPEYVKGFRRDTGHPNPYWDVDDVIVACQVFYSFGVGVVERSFESVCWISILPIFDADGRRTGFEVSDLSEFGWYK